MEEGPTPPFLKLTFMSIPGKSDTKLEEHCQGHTEHGHAQAQVTGLECQVVLFIAWWVYTKWWEFCIWKRKGNCITKVTGPCNPWEWVEAIWTKESRLQGHGKMKWTSHKVQNHKGETSFPLKIKQKHIVTLGTRFFLKLPAIWRRKEMPGINLSFWEMKKKWVTTFSTGLCVLLSNPHDGRITSVHMGKSEINSIQQIFIYLLSCVENSLGWENQMSQQNLSFIPGPR